MRTTHTVTGLLLSLVAASSAAAGGTFSSAAITGDADSGISGAKTYTHAIDLYGGIPGTAINGVLFAPTGPFGPQYSTTGLFNPRGVTANHSVPAGDNTLWDLLSGFFGPGIRNIETLTLTGLTPGTTYTTTFYGMGFDVTRPRVNTVTTSDGGSTVFDQNFTGEGMPNVLRYTFTARSESITYTFTPQDYAAPFHQYGFSNEVVPEPGGAGLLLVAGALACARRRPGVFK